MGGGDINLEKKSIFYFIKHYFKYIKLYFRLFKTKKKKISSGSFNWYDDVTYTPAENFDVGYK